MAKIFVIEKNKVYDSVSKAAKALGVDASNINKVVKGKRASAGGYHFFAFEQRKDLERAKEIYKEYTRAKEKKKVLTKAERKARNNLIDKVHDRLVDVNQKIRNARKENLFKADPVLQKMLSHADYYGYNRTGGFDTSKQNLRTFTTEELNNLLDLLARDQGEYAKSLYDNMSKTRNIASYALQFGITIPQAEQYYYIYPTLFELFTTAKQNTEYKYSDIYGEIYDAIQGEADPDELLDFVLDLKNLYQGNTSEDLDTILEKWAEARGRWQENWEAIH